MLLALPLLPSSDIQRGFDIVRTYVINHNVPMVGLFDYYQNFWLRRVGVDTLSVNGLPRRTNNCVESFHNSLRIKFNVVHPNLWVFLNHLSHLNKNVHITVTQLSNNLRPTRKQTKNVLTNLKRIQNSIQEYSLGLITMWQFLCRTVHVTSAYEQRQRNWALHVEAEIRPPPLPEAAVEAPPPEEAVCAPPPEAAVGAPPLPPPEAAVRTPQEIPSIQVRPTAATRPASARRHPYYHQDNPRHGSNAAEAWTWFYADDLNINILFNYLI
uniref:Uncharacterized protein n=1 Tax=Schizaphis graminum TaxID=13262 RepID=A0A2S2NHI5_SCHGA